MNTTLARPLLILLACLLSCSSAEQPSEPEAVYHDGRGAGQQETQGRSLRWTKWAKINDISPLRLEDISTIRFQRLRAQGSADRDKSLSPSGLLWEGGEVEIVCDLKLQDRNSSLLAPTPDPSCALEVSFRSGSVLQLIWNENPEAEKLLARVYWRSEGVWRYVDEKSPATKEVSDVRVLEFLPSSSLNRRIGTNPRPRLSE